MHFESRKKTKKIEEKRGRSKQTINRKTRGTSQSEDNKTKAEV